MAYTALLSLLTRQLSCMAAFFTSTREHTSADESDKQVELSRKSGNIWSSLLAADFVEVKRILSIDPMQALERGAVGELPLHLAFLYNSDAHFEIAKFLIEKYPETISQVYLNPEYHGENVLHIAIVNKKIDRIKYLIDRAPELLFAQADGFFFQIDQPCYFGEFPLSFAASTRQKTLVEYLVKKGAQLDAEDSHGNNVLHVCVIHSLQDMYAYILELWHAIHPNPSAILVPLDKRRNKQGFTPFVLAAYLNHVSMVQYLMDSNKKQIWTYGHVSCQLFQMDELDPLPDDFHNHKKGALQVIVNRANLDVLSLPKITELLNTKWEKCAADTFFYRFIATLGFCFVFMLSAVFRHSADEDYFTISMRFATEFLVFIVWVYKTKRELREFQRSGLEYFQGRGSALLENVLSSIFCLMQLATYLLRLIQSPYSDIAFSMSSLACWFYLLFFLLGFRLTGPFIIMMFHMLAVDMVRFASLVFVFYMGFAQSIYVIFEEDGFWAFFCRFRSMFLTMLNDFDFDMYSESKHSWIAVSLLLTFVIVVSIVILNIFVAMLSSTYVRISEDADKQWLLERARITFAIQNEMSSSELNAPHYRYWTEIKGMRYLQVIAPDTEHYTLEDEQEQIKNRAILKMCAKSA